MLLEVFKTGSHTDSRGVTREFTEQHLDEIADYDRARHRAPWLKFHKPGMGCFGQIKQVIRLGEKLFADFFRVDKAFSEEVNKGKWPGLSIGLYAPDDPNNPKPGVWQLQEISSLPIPSVKGMGEPFVDEAAIAYAEGDCAVQIKFGEVQFGGWQDRTILQLFRGLRDYLIEEKGAEVADRLMPSYMLDSLQEAIAQEAVEDALEHEMPAKPLYAEGGTMTEDELKAAQDQLAADRAAFAETQRVAAKTIKFTEWLKPHIEAGRVLPAEQGEVVATMIQLDVIDRKVEFGEGDGKESISPLASYKRQIERRAKSVDFQEWDMSQSDVPAQIIFQAPDGVIVGDKEVYARAKAYHKLHPEVDLIDAYKAVGGK